MFFNVTVIQHGPSPPPTIAEIKKETVLYVLELGLEHSSDIDTPHPLLAGIFVAIIDTDSAA